MDAQRYLTAARDQIPDVLTCSFQDDEEFADRVEEFPVSLDVLGEAPIGVSMARECVMVFGFGSSIGLARPNSPVPVQGRRVERCRYLFPLNLLGRCQMFHRYSGLHRRNCSSRLRRLRRRLQLRHSGPFQQRQGSGTVAVEDAMCPSPGEWPPCHCSQRLPATHPLERRHWPATPRSAARAGHDLRLPAAFPNQRGPRPRFARPVVRAL